MYHEDIDWSEACFRIEEKRNFLGCSEFGCVLVYFRKWSSEVALSAFVIVRPI